MAEADFVPFVPRPAKCSSRPLGRLDGAVESIQPTVDNAIESQAPLSGAVEPAPPTTANADEPPGRLNEVEGDESECSSRPLDRLDATLEPARPSCDHERQIRHAAIRLAAIACGRALRHAIVMHPAVIAGFVDDAIAAIGNPSHVRIRSHPDAVAGIANTQHERIADPNLEPGDVKVELDGTSIEANVDSFAALLARAAAEV